MEEGNGRAPKGKRVEEEVLYEYPSIGKYRIRVVRNPSRRTGGTSFDVREYISGDSFEGFTRKGVRFGNAQDLLRLSESIQDALGRSMFEEGFQGKVEAA